MGQLDGIFAEAKKRIQSQEVGATGTVMYNGYVMNEEFNSELQKIQALEIWDKMIRTDAQVKATTLAIELPIRAAEWSIISASDDPADIEIADFVKHEIMLNKYYSWDALLRHMIKHLWYGYYVFEKVYEIKDGKIGYKKIAPRKPNTIQRWFLKDGALDGVEQFVYKDGLSYESLTIPGEKLIVFTNDREGSNYEGMSMFRSAYRNWYTKDRLIKIDAIRHEKQGLGVPKISRKDGAIENTNDATQAANVGENFRAHEKGYLYVPPGWEIEMLDMKAGSTSDILSSIKYHNTEISANIMAQFLDLGKTDTGSRAVGQTHKQLFTNSLKAVTNYIEYVFNEGQEGRQIIKEIVDLNFSGVKEYPRLKCGRIEDVEFLQVSAGLNNLAKSGISFEGFEMQNWMRDLVNAPKISREDYDAEVEEKAKKAEALRIQMQTKKDEEDQTSKDDEDNEDQNDQDQNQDTGKIEKKMSEGYWRELTALEKSINLTEIDQTLRKYESEVIDTGLKNRKFVIDQMTAYGQKILSQKLDAKSFVAKMDKAKDTMPGYFQFVKDETNILKDMDKYSRQKVRAEIQGIRFAEIIEDPEEVKKTIRPWVEASAGFLFTKIWNEWKRQLLKQYDNGAINTESLKEAMTGLTTSDFVRDFQEISRKTFGKARNSEAFKIKDNVEYIVRSEIMDEKICNNCPSIDGEEFTFNDPLWGQVANGPYTQCEGGDRCRGINIFVKGQ